MAVGRAAVLLKADYPDLGLTLIRNDPDHAGLIGAVHLAPSWIFKGHDAILAADIGGTNIRGGVVEFDVKSDPTLAKASVWKREHWRHADEKNLSRSEAVKKLVNMLTDLIERARKQKLHLAPFILSDNGPSYLSSELGAWLENKGINYIRGRAYHPTTHGRT